MGNYTAAFMNINPNTIDRVYGERGKAELRKICSLKDGVFSAEDA